MKMVCEGDVMVTSQESPVRWDHNVAAAWGGGSVWDEEEGKKKRLFFHRQNDVAGTPWKRRLGKP